MKIAIGCDHAAFDEKNKLITHLQIKNFLVKDFGCFSKNSVDYPDYASLVAKEIQNKHHDLDNFRQPAHSSVCCGLRAQGKALLCLGIICRKGVKEDGL